MLARWCLLKISALLLALPLSAGCGSDSETETRQPATLPALDLSSPESATRAALTCLQEQARAIGDHHPAAAKAWTERLHQIAALDSIESLLNSTPQLRIVLGNDPVAKYISLWGASVSYYFERFDFDASRRTKIAKQGAAVTVVVQAHGHGQSAMIKVDCVRGADELWRVAYIGLGDAVAIAAPTTQSTP